MTATAETRAVPKKTTSRKTAGARKSNVTDTDAPKAAAPSTLTIEQAMEAIGEYAQAQGKDWRDALRKLWKGKGDGSVLHAAHEVVPAAILDNLSFKAVRQLTPEQETAKRLRAAGKALRTRATALQQRAKEINALARQLQQKDKPRQVTALMRKLHDDGQLAAIEAEVAV